MQDSGGTAPGFLEMCSSEAASASSLSPVFVLSPLYGQCGGRQSKFYDQAPGSAIYPSIVGALCPHRGKLEDLKRNN